jgi:hypothetical protein
LARFSNTNAEFEAFLESFVMAYLARQSQTEIWTQVDDDTFLGLHTTAQARFVELCSNEKVLIRLGKKYKTNVDFRLEQLFKIANRSNKERQLKAIRDAGKQRLHQIIKESFVQVENES